MRICYQPARVVAAVIVIAFAGCSGPQNAASPSLSGSGSAGAVRSNIGTGIASHPLRRWPNGESTGAGDTMPRRP